jgi:redox-sensitive bicupin YhaK (pirin superfamily)
MPAVTADTLTLPRLEVPVAGPGGAAPRPRPVRSVTTAPTGYEGEGFPVRRAFAGLSHADLDPFVHMDQMGEVDWKPYEPRGTDWHPHRGFETVTYIIDGTFQHQDSHGGGGTITNGGTQWMTAGRGILHIETPPEKLVISGGTFHGVQLWVNLPRRSKMAEPRYQNLEPGKVTLLSSPDGGALVRLIAGDLGGHRGPGRTHTPIVVSHVTLAPGARVVVPWDPSFNALAYALAGRGSAGEEAAPLATGQLALFGGGDTLTLTAAADETLDVLLLGGEPIREPVVQYGPFVMNTKAEIQQAFDDFQRGRLGTVPPNGLKPFTGRRRR